MSSWLNHPTKKRIPPTIPTINTSSEVVSTNNVVSDENCIYSNTTALNYTYEDTLNRLESFNKNNRNTRKRVDPRILPNSTYAQQLSQGANKGAGVGPLYRQPNNVYRENRGFALNGLGPQNFNEQGYIPKRQILQPEGASVRQ